MSQGADDKTNKQSDAEKKSSWSFFKKAPDTVAEVPKQAADALKMVGNKVADTTGVCVRMCEICSQTNGVQRKEQKPPWIWPAAQSAVCRTLHRRSV